MRAILYQYQTPCKPIAHLFFKGVWFPAQMQHREFSANREQQNVSTQVLTVCFQQSVPQSENVHINPLTAKI